MVKITKWFEDKAPKETEFRSVLESEGFTVETKTEEAGVMQDPSVSNQEKSLVVLEGLARITLPDLPEDFMDLMAGDRLDIPKGTNHGLMIGPAGATILEGKK